MITIKRILRDSHNKNYFSFKLNTARFKMRLIKLRCMKNSFKTVGEYGRFLNEN